MVPKQFCLQKLQSRQPEQVETSDNRMTRLMLQTLYEAEEAAAIRLGQYQQIGARHYNKGVKLHKFQIRNNVLRKVFQNTQKLNTGKLGQNWEGPYQIKEIVCLEAYKLQDIKGISIP